jgi:N-acetylglucosamine-6-phosphate deacetylase
MNAPDYAVAARWVFDGVKLCENMAVVVGGDRVISVVPTADAQQIVPVQQLPENVWLAPGFIDIQVNGGGDVLFNDAPSAETIRTIVRAHRRFGTTALLPTLISDSSAKMKAALAAAEDVSAIEPGVLGVHLEGPFLSPDKAGIHDPRVFRSPTVEDIAILTTKRTGVVLVTLAPEQVPAGTIAKLAAAGVRVALGHSMATYEQATTAIAEGLTGFTHLFNAMRPLESREPGPIGAALESSDTWYGLIADGIHIAPSTLRLALRGAGRPILVTDAMPPVGGAKSYFALNGEKIIASDGCCKRKDGVLAGTYLEMATAVRNCVRFGNVPLSDALRFASANPAEFLGLGNTLGRLAPGYRADMVAFDGEKIEVQQTWVAGVAWTD